MVRFSGNHPYYATKVRVGNDWSDYCKVVTDPGYNDNKYVTVGSVAETKLVVNVVGAQEGEKVTGPVATDVCYSGTCTYSGVLTNANLTATTNTGRTVSWTKSTTGCGNPSSASPLTYGPINVASGQTCTINATFSPASGEVDLDFGLDKKYLNWSNPGTYPSPVILGNKDYVFLYDKNGNGGQFKINNVSFGEMDEIAGQKSCIKPVLYYTTDRTRTGNPAKGAILEAGTTSIDRQHRLYVYFEEKCVRSGTNGQSAYFRSKPYNITLSIENANSLSFEYFFNDSSR